mmetsp:Transcript_16147/g.27612  ORF Transcript_16147/g.27612 Transcript_16147/m.27612 type:complete len:519 (-) Transcript_16147:32-1588(-)
MEENISQSSSNTSKPQSNVNKKNPNQSNNESKQNGASAKKAGKIFLSKPIKADAPAFVPPINVDAPVFVPSGSVSSSGVDADKAPNRNQARKRRQQARKKARQQQQQQQQKQGKPKQKQKQNNKKPNETPKKKQQKGERRPPSSQLQYDITHDRKKADKARIVQLAPSAKHVALFSHLPQFEKATSISLNVGFAAPEFHSVVVALGLKLADGVIRGGNDCAVALLRALQQLVRDFVPPARGSLAHDFESYLKPHIQFLIDCRPLTVSMANAIKYFKVHIGLTLDQELSEARKTLHDTIDTYITERVLLAGKVIAKHAASKIVNDDVVMIYSTADCVEMALAEAQQRGTRFRVVMCDDSTRQGMVTLRRLVKLGIECDYVLLSGASYKIAEVTKVLLGCEGMMSNGACFARAGTAAIAMLAHAQHVPVIVLCETYKFCERVQLDSITQNELLDPDAIVRTFKQESPVADWRSVPDLTLLALRYDITPITFVNAVATEVGLIPPTSVPVVVREFRREVAS